MAIVTTDKVHAMCGVTAAAFTAVTFAHNDGFNAQKSTHSAAGTYALVFDEPLAQAGGTVCPSIFDGTGSKAYLDTQISADGTTLNVLVYDNTGALSDAFGFTVTTFRMPYAEGA